MDWNLYDSLLNVKGDTRRERAIYETQRSIRKRSVRSPAYKHVLVDGQEQELIITSSIELFYKKISTMPNEHIYVGQTVLWNDTYWIITNADTEDEVYQRGLMYKCNICLKWQNEKGEILVRYGYSEDISQFAAGVVESKVLNSLQFNLRAKFPLDTETAKLRRDKRFLIDVLTDEPYAFILTQRNVITENFHPQNIDENYEFEGRDKILYLTLCETQLSKKDNLELMIADYFEPNPVRPPELDGESFIAYKGEPKIKSGGSFKTFKSVFKDVDGNEIKDIIPQWNVTILPEYEQYFEIVQENNDLKIKVQDIPEVVNSFIRISMIDVDGKYPKVSLDVKVVSIIYG